MPIARMQDTPAPDTQPQAEGAETVVVEAVPASELEAGFGDFVSRVSQGDFSAQTWISFWESVGQPVALALVLIIAVLVVSAWAKGMTTGIARKAKVEETLARFLGNIVKYAIMAAGGVAILGTLGIETTSFAAVLAAVGFAIGMALSGTLGNVASGVMLLLFRPFKVGDVVNAAGITAKVIEIGLFHTVFDTVDNRRIIVPNAKISDDTIENITFHDLRRCDITVGIAYDADVDEGRAVLERVCAEAEGGLNDPAPQVYLSELGASSVDFALRVWCNAADYWALRERLMRDSKKALDAAGIGIPFPQRDVHVPGPITVKVENN